MPMGCFYRQPYFHVLCHYCIYTVRARCGIGAILYKHIGVGSALLVQLYRAMREPQVVERATGMISTLFLCSYCSYNPFIYADVWRSRRHSKSSRELWRRRNKTKSSSRGASSSRKQQKVSCLFLVLSFWQMYQWLDMLRMEIWKRMAATMVVVAVVGVLARVHGEEHVHQVARGHVEVVVRQHALMDVMQVLVDGRM